MLRLKQLVVEVLTLSQIYLIRAGGLVGTVVITEVLVCFGRLRLSVYTGM